MTDMTNPHDRIEEGRRLQAKADEAIAEHEALGPYTGDRLQGHPEAEAKRFRATRSLSGYMRDNADYFLHTLPSELEAAHARIAALEEALRPFAPSPETLQAIQYIHDGGELYLAGNGWEIGPITAGDLRRAATLLSSAPGGEGEDKVVSYLYRNPDSGWEVSVNHPVDSGEVPDAEYIEPISGTVHNLLTEAWASPTPAPAEDVVERVAREIDPGAWSVMDAEKARFLRKYSGETIGYPEEQFQHKTSMEKARAILAIVSDGAAAGEPVGYTNENQLNYVAGGGDGLFFPDDKMGCPIALYRAPPALSALPLDRNRIREIRERHEATDRKEYPSEDELYEAHADRAFLLQQLSNVMGDKS